MDSNGTNITEITQDRVPEIKNELKTFLVSRAQREAVKMDDLQSALEVMQKKYIERSMSYIADHDDDSAILYLPEMIKNVSQYLKDSGDSIKSVLSNQELFDKVCIQQNNVTVGNVNIEASTLDADSRRKVRNVLSEILKTASEDVISDTESTVE